MFAFASATLRVASTEAVVSARTAASVLFTTDAACLSRQSASTARVR